MAMRSSSGPVNVMCAAKNATPGEHDVGFASVVDDGTGPLGAGQIDVDELATVSLDIVASSVRKCGWYPRSAARAGTGVCMTVDQTFSALPACPGRLLGKTALVTGAASGLGAAIAA